MDDFSGKIRLALELYTFHHENPDGEKLGLDPESPSLTHRTNTLENPDLKWVLLIPPQSLSRHAQLRYSQTVE